MKKLFFPLVVFLLSAFSTLDSARAEIMIGAAADSIYERGMDLSIGPQAYTDVLAFYKSSIFYFGAEYFSQSTSPQTGQQTYNLKRLRRGGLFEFLCQAANWGALNPYFSMGFGGYQDQITTVFMSSSSVDTSRFYLAGFGGLGVKFDNLEPVFLALETRLIFGENLDPQPTVSARAILGIKF